MMKTFLFSILLFLFTTTFSQQIKFSVQGVVRDQESKQPVKKATLRLTGSDGSGSEQQTDSTGRYCFDSSKVKLDLDYVLKVFGDKSGYFNGPTVKITTLGYSASTSFIHDIELKKNYPIIDYFPSVSFDKNLAFLKPTQNDSLNLMYLLLMDNPNIIIEIRGHCSFDEQLPQSLSEARAKEARKYLITKGIDPARLISKAYGTSKPYIDRKGKVIDLTEINKKGNTPAEKELMQQLNRRVIFSITRNDYVPDKK